MNILVTGAKGMVGTALVNNLKNIKDGKNKTRPNIIIDEIFEYDIDSSEAELEEYCQKADFVFNLAGVNRPKNEEDFMNGNFGFGSTLLDTLKKYNNKATVMLSSSVQATLSGRFGNSEYGRSKKAGEDLFFDYGKKTGAKVAVYRFPNLMGHSRPKYNSAVSTFCWAVANDEPFTVTDPKVELELLYIDDLVEGMIRMMNTEDEFTGPVNLGNPNEFPILELAERIIRMTGSSSRIVFKQLLDDDPKQRQPDITLAKEKLGWQPTIELEDGLKYMIEYFKTV